MIACITGFIHWAKVKKTFWKVFPIYLFFVVCSETFGIYSTYYKYYEISRCFFDYFEIPTEFLFFFWLFHKNFKAYKFKILPIICAGLYLGSWIAEIIYFHTDVNHFLSLSYTVGNLLLLVLIVCFFYKLINSELILGFKNNRLFWISTGLLIFYLGSFPYFGLENLMVRNYTNLFYFFRNIMLVLNSVMYIMFTLSFIWGKQNSVSS